jgi:hypothetical protein
MTNTFRALCAELIDELDYQTCNHEADDLIDRARAALTVPEQVGPTDEELWALGNEDFRANCYPTDAIRYARAVLARWGNQS